MATESQYNHQQQVFLLCMMANLGEVVEGITGTGAEIEDKLRSHIIDLLPKLGNWSLVWGPCAYQARLNPTHVPDNGMFVAQRSGEDGEPDHLVVAIAGTNRKSLFGWLIEDGGVSRLCQRRWVYGDPRPPRARISDGTAVGLGVLQAMKPDQDIPGAGQAISDFLATRAGAGPVAITVTGHSLGGALAPALALWLRDTQPAWDPAGNVTIHCMAAAGATPGNANFAEYYQRRLGATTRRIHNTLDVVPHVWNRDGLKRLPHLYEPEIPADLAIKAVAEVLRALSLGGRYQQITDDEGLEGALHEAPGDGDKSPACRFIEQALYQHVQAYFALFGLEFRDFVAMVGKPSAHGQKAGQAIATVEKCCGFSCTG